MRYFELRSEACAALTPHLDTLLPDGVRAGARRRVDPPAEYPSAEEVGPDPCLPVRLDALRTEYAGSACGGPRGLFPAMASEENAFGLMIDRERSDWILAAGAPSATDSVHPGSIAEQGSMLLYPAPGHLGWHTNERTPDWRLYFSFVARGARSYFRYAHIETGAVVTRWEQAGWTGRMFRIEAAEDRAWHCVATNVPRWSFGWRVSTPSEDFEPNPDFWRPEAIDGLT